MDQAGSAPSTVKELSERTGHRLRTVSIAEKKIIYHVHNLSSAVERLVRINSLRMKRKWWSGTQGTKADVQRKLLQTWRLSHQESVTLHATADRVGGQRKRWVRDLTREGIHPHPGPLDLWTVNVQGAAHAHSLLQLLEERKPATACIQEVGLSKHQLRNWRAIAIADRQGYFA